MYKLTIENFQSLEYAEIDLEGFCTIQGPSNRGKSAIIRALGVLFYNEWDSDYLREGAKECKISLEIDKGEVEKLEIIKPKNTYNVYYRNGEIKEYPKIDRDTPKDVKKLGLDIVKTERGDKFNLNLQYQLDNMFLISDREPVITSFLNTIFKIEEYKKALKNINSDMLKLNKQSKKDQKEIELKKSELKDINEEYEHKAKRYNEVKKAYKEYIQLKEKIEFIEKGENSFKEIKASRENLEILKLEHKWYEKLNNQIKNYIYSLYGVNDIDKLIGSHCKSVNDLEILNNKYEESNKVFIKIVKYRDCVQKVGELTFYIDTLQIKKENAVKIQEEYKVYNSIQKEVEYYYNCMYELKEISKYIDKLNEDTKLCTDKNTELKEFKKLYKYIQNILDCMGVILDIEKNIDVIEKADNKRRCLELEWEEHKEIRDELRGKENFIKIVVQKCPTCKKLL